jgi:hypothetical protein
MWFVAAFSHQHAWRPLPNSRVSEEVRAFIRYFLHGIRSPRPPPLQLNFLRSITFRSVTKVFESIVINMHFSPEFDSNA